MPKRNDPLDTQTLHDLAWSLEGLSSVPFDDKTKRAIASSALLLRTLGNSLGNVQANAGHAYDVLQQANLNDLSILVKNGMIETTK